MQNIYNSATKSSQLFHREDSTFFKMCRITAEGAKTVVGLSFESLNFILDT